MISDSPAKILMPAPNNKGLVCFMFSVSSSPVGALRRDGGLPLVRVPISTDRLPVPSALRSPVIGCHELWGLSTTSGSTPQAITAGERVTADALCLWIGAPASPGLSIAPDTGKRDAEERVNLPSSVEGPLIPNRPLYPPDMFGGLGRQKPHGWAALPQPALIHVPHSQSTKIAEYSDELRGCFGRLLERPGPIFQGGE